MDEPVEPESNPFDRVVGPWEQVLEDMAATAEEYRAAGHEVVELHPGDVATLTGEPRTLAEEEDGIDLAERRLGFDVVVPGEEFEAAQAALADRPVERYRAFAATGNGMVFALIAVETADDLAVLVPIYYDQSDRPDLEEVAATAGLATHVRSLTSDEVVTIEHADPSPLFPE